MIILDVKKLKYSMDTKTGFLKSGTNKLILDAISFYVAENKVLGIAGESGSGKTTLAKLLCGILKPDSGKIELKTGRREDIQMLFQNSGEIINPLRKVKNILNDTIKINKVKNREPDEEFDTVIKKINLKKELLERRGYELSGGEQQRVALARLLIVKPKILILDEPFAAQDSESLKKILEILRKLKSEAGLTLIIISHDLSALRSIADEIIILHSGKIVESGSAEKILNNPEDQYTNFLLQAEKFNLSYEEYLRSK